MNKYPLIILNWTGYSYIQIDFCVIAKGLCRGEAFRCKSRAKQAAPVNASGIEVIAACFAFTVQDFPDLPANGMDYPIYTSGCGLAHPCSG